MPKNLTLSPYLLLIFCSLLSIGKLSATHNRAGEITITQVGDCVTSLTVEALIVTYTRDMGTNVDRDTLTICWGDDICERVPRTNGGGAGEVLGENNTRYNEYRAIHTYPARGRYVISMTDPNRNGDIENVNYPKLRFDPFSYPNYLYLPKSTIPGLQRYPAVAPTTCRRRLRRSGIYPQPPCLRSGS